MITLTPTEDQIKKAKKLANEMGHVKNSVMSGSRNFIGFIGELMIADLLDCDHKPTKDYDLILKDGKTVDVKTFSSRYKPRQDFDCNVMKASKHQQCNIYVFTSYNIEKDILYICGYINHDDFYNQAVVRKKGEKSPLNGITYRSDGYAVPVSALKNIGDLV